MPTVGVFSAVPWFAVCMRFIVGRVRMAFREWYVI